VAIEATHELTRPGQKVAFVPSQLPSADETGGDLDFSHPDFENLRNAASGIASIFDDHTEAIANLDADPQWREFSPPYRQMRQGKAREAVAAHTIKNLARLEKIADGAEQEANQLAAELEAPEPVEPSAAQPIVASYMELPKESRVEVAHRAARLLAADSGADAVTRRHAREYLGALLQVNPLTGIVDPMTREFIQRVMVQTRNPEKWNRMHHLAHASKAIKQSAARVRTLMTRS
jgi:hypothetical protein